MDRRWTALGLVLLGGCLRLVDNVDWPCDSDADCDKGSTCVWVWGVGQRCREPEPGVGPEGSPCTKDADCDDGEACIQVLGVGQRCRIPDPEFGEERGGPCVADSHCVVGTACVGGTCVEAECSSTWAETCGAYVCNLDELKCFTGCEGDKECAGDYHCVGYECRSAPPANMGGAGGSGWQPTGGQPAGGQAIGPNLVLNGDFENGSEYWHFEPGRGNLRTVDSDGRFCVEVFSSDSFFRLGFPADPNDAFVLEAGTYEFSYECSYVGVGTGIFEAKVGLAVEPYDSIAVFDDLLTSGAAFHHVFEVDTAYDEPVGVVFNFGYLTTALICIDNVEIRQF